MSEVGINLDPMPRMVVVHFYDATGGLIKSDVIADPANMEVPVPYGAASFTATWAQDVNGEPVIRRASSVIQVDQAP